MKKKHRLILLFMLVFVGGTLLGYTPALTFQDDCDLSEVAAGTCIQIPEGNPIYILRAYVDYTVPKVYAEDLGIHWPISKGNKTIFRYITGVKSGAPKPSAQSYVWFSLHHKPPLGSNPPGAQLDITNIPAACGPVELGARIAYKLNKVASYTKDGVIELYENAGAGFDAKCGSAAVVWSSNCGGYPQRLLVPSGGDVPVQEITTFKCEDTGVTVEVTINPCTLQIDNVLCTGGGISGPATPTSNTWGRAQDLNDPNRIDQFAIENIGPGTPGCIVCAKPYPVVLRGNEAWWCGGPPSPAPTQ